MKLTQKLIQEFREKFEKHKLFAKGAYGFELEEMETFLTDALSQQEKEAYDVQSKADDKAIDLLKLRIKQLEDALSQVREETLKCPRHHEQLRCRGCQVELAEIEEENE